MCLNCTYESTGDTPVSFVADRNGIWGNAGEKTICSAVFADSVGLWSPVLSSRQPSFYRFRGAHFELQRRELLTMPRMFSGGPGRSHCLELTTCKHASIASSQMPLRRSVPQMLTSVRC